MLLVTLNKQVSSLPRSAHLRPHTFEVCSPEATHIWTCLSDQFTSHKKTWSYYSVVLHIIPWPTPILSIPILYLWFQFATYSFSFSSLSSSYKVPDVLRKPRNDWADLDPKDFPLRQVLCRRKGQEKQGLQAEGQGSLSSVHSRSQSDWGQLICLLSIHSKCH